MLEFFENNWLIIVAVVLLYLERKGIKSFLYEAVAGDDNKVSYKELSGTIAIFALVVMLIKDIIDVNYAPDTNLLYIFGGLIFSLAGIEITKGFIKNKKEEKNAN